MKTQNEKRDMFYGAFPCIVAFISCFISVLTCNGQGADSVSYKNLNDPAFVSNYKLKFDIKTYTTADGSVLKIGSPLVIGRPEKNESKRDNFPFTYWQLVTMIGKIKAFEDMTQDNAGEQVVIEEIMATTESINKKSPRQVDIIVTNINGKRRSLVNYEKALQVGEVMNPNAALTREQAMKRLKESKDLLDLGVINQSKFDSIKAVLSPIILKQ